MAAPTVINEIVPTGPFTDEGSAPFATLSLVAADVTNGNKVVMANGRALFIFQNVAVAAKWVSIPSSKDAFGRKADIANIAVPAGGFVCKVLTAVGWEQTLGGKDILINAESVDIKIAAIQL